MENFELFRGRAMAFTKPEPIVTMLGRGGFSFNRPAYEAIGEPSAILLFYDRATQRIGFKAAERGDEFAYPILKQNSSANFIFGGKAFFRAFDIPYGPVARRYHPEQEGGLFIIDLKGEAETVTNRRGRAKDTDPRKHEHGERTRTAR